jgi:hypothetical protein
MMPSPLPTAYSRPPGYRRALPEERRIGRDVERRLAQAEVGLAWSGQAQAIQVRKACSSVARRTGRGIGRGAAETDGAVVQDGHAVAQLVHIGQRVRGQEHGAAGAVQAAQLVLEQGARFRVEAGHRLVEDVHRLARQQAGGQAQLLGHAFGIAAHLPLERGRIEVERGQHGAHGLRLVAHLARSAGSA